MNEALSATYTLSEVRHALFQMHPSKAPGNDGFPAGFYQKFWNIIGGEVGQDIVKALNEGRLNNKWNETVIILIPKIKEATKMTEFRPISLCNILMKIVTKVLANRVKGFLAEVISPAQSAFIEGRLITDNILVSHELDHYIKTRKGKTGYLSLKLDINKAYDKVSWEFLERMLKALGFCKEWIDRVMMCIKSVTYKIKINGKLSSPIIPQKGLRQGDPISPYLFLICTEWLSTTLAEKQKAKKIQGVKISQRAPRVNHLLFADDCLVFMQVNIWSLGELKKILDKFRIYAGQEMNLQKSEIRFGANVDPIFRNVISNFMNIRAVEKHSKYLGLPITFGQNKKDMFKFIVEKMEQRVLSWKAQTLSQAGKEIMIKAVLLPIPQYAMSCYMLPKGINNKLTSIMLKYWWCNGNKDSGIYWMKKEGLYKVKDRGGLGLRNLEIINEAFLLKQMWRIYTKHDTLLSLIFTNKYTRTTNVMEPLVAKPTDSLAWKSLCKVSTTFLQAISHDPQTGTISWTADSTGEFSLKSAYFYIHNKKQMSGNLHGEPSSWRLVENYWKKIWKANLPGKIKLLSWRVYHNIIPTFLNLVKRGCEVVTKCWFCGFRREDAYHVFFECWWAKVFWEKTELCLPVINQCRNLADWLHLIADNLNEEKLHLFLIGIWILWSNRNMVIHDKTGWNIETCIAKFRFWGIQIKGNNVLGGYTLYDTVTMDEEKKLILCDGSWSNWDQAEGFACVFFENDYIRAIRADWAKSCNSPLCSEVKAIYIGMEMGEKLSEKILDICSDSVQAIWTVQTGQVGCQKCISFSVKCSIYLANNHGWSLKHIPRSSNGVADWLASRARELRWKWDCHNAIPLAVHCCRRMLPLATSTTTIRANETVAETIVTSRLNQSSESREC